MLDEIISTEDLKQLRVIAPTDRRQFDQWAWDDSFCANLLDHAFANPARPEQGRWHWKQAIEIFWRGNKSRRDLANELGLTFDAIKSLITTIRKTAEDFKTAGSIAAQHNSSPKTPKTNWSLAHTIGTTDIFALFDEDAEKAKAASTFLEEFRRLSTINLLGLFNDGISGRLIDAFQEGNGDAQCVETPEITALKLSVARDDPFEGRPFCSQPVQWTKRTKYEIGQRGRPRKEKPAVRQIKRKRGRPKKVYTPTITDAPVASEFFLLPGGQQFCSESRNIDAQHIS
jgi:hypothetical protein